MDCLLFVTKPKEGWPDLSFTHLIGNEMPRDKHVVYSQLVLTPLSALNANLNLKLLMQGSLLTLPLLSVR